MNAAITTALTRDHAKVRSAIARVIHDPSLAPSLYPAIADALRRHSAAEESTLYAALASIPEQAQVVGELEQGHRALAQILESLDAMPYGASKFLSVFANMSQALDAHIGFEETHVFPLAQAILARSRQHVLGRRYEERMGSGRTSNISILLPALSKPRTNPCGCAGAKQGNPCGCAKKNPPVKWFHHFVGAGPALLRALKR
jgi:hypothetical protein